ncbi:phenol hydroxylase subunit P4 [Hydrogenophaga sp.]|uniref:phenol hydroxylase subunit P4 n=1 Tax=Hydrogenophaga sp. TaxID=1904254 RepID=UPI003567D974
MSVVALKPYDFPVKDVHENFPAPLLYIGWEGHLLFCAPFCLPLPPDTPFGALASGILPGIFGYHPDFAQIDWDKAEWKKNGQAWKPDPTKSLADNGLQHKDAIRFRSPGLTGIKGSGS